MKATWQCATIAALFAVTGCGGATNGTLPGPSHSATSGLTKTGGPNIVQTGSKPINWTQLNDPTTGFSNAYSIVTGSDNNMWLGNSSGGLMQVKMTGTEKLFTMTYVCNGTSSCTFVPGYGITVGSDGKFYMTGTNYNYTTSRYVIGVAAVAGSLVVHDIPSADYGGSGGLTLGPDHNVWFTEQKHVAKITPTGTITEYSYPSGATSNSYGSTTTGPDGNVWFTEYNNQIVAKVVPATGTITEYSVASLGCNPTSIVSAPDGNLYFSCSNYLGQITTSGVSARFYDPFGISYFPEGLKIGPDSNIWFADGNGAYIGEFNPTNISFTEYVPPYTGGTVYDLALGPDGNFWSPESDNKINVYLLKVLGVSPTSLSFASTGLKANLTVSEPGTTKWTATSISSGVCSVAQGSSANIFVVTAAGAGTTKITVKDAIGNSFVVPCKVK